LYAFHSSPWVEVFGFHYTLDRSAVRAQYEASVFGSIAVFSIAIAGFWIAGRIRRVGPVARRPREHAVTILLATGLASGLATLVLWIAVSVQDGFPLAASLVGSASVLVGGLLTLLAGGTLSVLCAGLLELSLSEPPRSDPVSTAGVGFVFGVGAWVIAIPVPLAAVTGSDIPLLHVGSLAAVVAHGVVCGTVYGLVRGAFSPRAPVWLGSTAGHPSHESN
jgi:hypothetical protein